MSETSHRRLAITQNGNKGILRRFARLLIVLLCTSSQLPVTAQQGGTTTYVHDANGRLHAVISPTGDAAVYEYDEAGNITAIRRLTPTSVAILNFSPQEGLPGDQVKFLGVGFGEGVNDVSFNGVSAGIVSVSASTIVAIVPHATTTGRVTILTPRGSVTTTESFTIAGLRISPTFAALKFEQSVQFKAEVFPSPSEQNVQWSVDDAIGGNSRVGTISSTGLYTAPTARQSSVTIRANSITEVSRFAEAHVRVSDPDDVQSVFATTLSVQQNGSLGVAPLSASVAVRYNTIADLQTALSRALSVQYENSSGQSAALANISVNPGPYIQEIRPSSLTRGTTVTLTVNGPGLAGAFALRFITAGGAIDPSLTVSNIVVSPDGATVTANIGLSANAAAGSRTVVVATANGDSLAINLGSNTVNVQ